MRGRARRKSDRKRVKGRERGKWEVVYSSEISNERDVRGNEGKSKRKGERKQVEGREGKIGNYIK